MCLSFYLSLIIAWRLAGGLAPHHRVTSSVQTSPLSKHEPPCGSEVLAVATLITAAAPIVTANPSQPLSWAFLSRFYVVCLPLFLTSQRSRGSMSPAGSRGCAGHRGAAMSLPSWPVVHCTVSGPSKDPPPPTLPHASQALNWPLPT